MQGYNGRLKKLKQHRAKNMEIQKRTMRIIIYHGEQNIVRK
jgi:hypothetical protein